MKASVAVVRLETRALLRARGGALVALVLIQATLVAWVAWYLAEAVWASAPLSAPRSPLDPVVWSGAAIAATLVTIASGLGLGATALGGPWQGPDPTAALPLGVATRALSAWAGTAVLLAVTALAPAPVCLLLHEMGAVPTAELLRLLLVQAGAVLLAPLAGVALALGWGRVAPG